MAGRPNPSFKIRFLNGRPLLLPVLLWVLPLKDRLVPDHLPLSRGVGRHLPRGEVATLVVLDRDLRPSEEEVPLEVPLEGPSR